MLRKPDFRHLLRADLRDSPSWVNVLLSPFNDMIEFLLDAFDSNISVSNLNTQTLQFTITAPFVLTRFAKTKTDPVYGVFLNQIMKTDNTVVGVATGMDWYEDGTSIVISNLYGLTNGVAYNVKITVLY